MATSWGGFRIAAVAVHIFAFSFPAWAQSATDLQTIQRQQERILQREEQRLDELERQRRQERPPVPAIPLPEAPALPEGGACFTLKSVTFQGADHLSAEDQRRVVAPYVGRCITLAEADEIVRAVTNLYGERGYVTSRATIPPQDVGDGELEILVIEGRIEGFDWNGEDATGRSERLTAFPGTVGEILDLRDAEQGLDQINRLRSNSARMKLVPGAAPGGSRIAIENEPRKRWRLSAGIDNSGSDPTGDIQHKGSAEVDNLFGLNESLYLSHNQDDLQNSSQRLSRSWSAQASIPYGYWTLSATSSYFQYRSTVQGQAQSFLTSGMSRTNRLNLDRVLHRDSEGKTSGGVSLSLKSVRNYLEDVLLETSSRKLAVLGLSLSHTRKLAGGTARIGIGHETGLPMLGAKNDSGRRDGDPEAQFEKLTADVSYTVPFRLLDLNLSWSTTARGQWSNDTLFSTERQSIGSETTVRGFKEDSLSGDSGGYVRNELSLALPTTIAEIDGALGVPRLFLGYDVGAIKRDHGGGEGGRLSGWATGLRMAGEHLEAELTYARALARDHTVEPKSHEITFSLSLAY